MDRPPETPLTILAGFDRAAVADVGAALLLSATRLALVWVDPFTAELGYVQSRVTDSEGRCTEQTVELEHGCLSCAMREAVVRAVRRLHRTGRYDAILVHLHPGVETAAAVASLRRELTGTARIDTVAFVLHRHWLDDLAGDATAATKGIAVAPGDDRSAATILATGLETATVLIEPDGRNRAPGPAEHGTLSVLAPDAVRLYLYTPFDVDRTALLRTGGFHPGLLDPLAVRGLLDPRRTLPADCDGLRIVRWRSRLPIHPQRLHAALNQLADGVIRSTGRLWLATRPDLVVRWESAGDCLSLGPAGVWPTNPGRDTVGRRPHPHASRSNHLALLGDELDADHLRRVLDGCLLTDAELATGAGGWRDLPDPFPDWSNHPDARPGAQGVA